MHHKYSRQRHLLFKKLLATIAAFGMSSTGLACAYVSDYSPLSLKGLWQYTCPCPSVNLSRLPAAASFEQDGFRFQLKDSDVFIDRKVKDDWQRLAVVAYGGLGQTAYIDDLNGDGSKDLLLASATASCAPLPQTRVQVILSQDHAVLFDQIGFARAGSVFSDRLRLPGLSPNPVLVMEQLHGDGKESYWSTELLSFQPDGMVPLKRFQGSNLPIRISYSMKPNRRILPAEKLRRSDDKSVEIVTTLKAINRDAQSMPESYLFRNGALIEAAPSIRAGQPQACLYLERGGQRSAVSLDTVYGGEILTEAKERNLPVVLTLGSLSGQIKSIKLSIPEPDRLN
ncbi:MAG: hypothetical protein SFV17_26660 [Candidatus Obscuribacter sp.]|nr:hypothetical protein [Candidatus Obscuribacter sp.]